jgi:hypothetical protein
VNRQERETRLRAATEQAQRQRLTPAIDDVQSRDGRRGWCNLRLAAESGRCVRLLSVRALPAADCGLPKSGQLRILLLGCQRGVVLVDTLGWDS